MDLFAAVSPRTLAPGRINLTSCPISFIVTSPNTTTPPTTPPTLPQVSFSDTCGNETITAPTGLNGSLETLNWPHEIYPFNVDCEWKLKCSGTRNGIDIIFNNSFRVAGKMPSCEKDFVKVVSCGTTYGPFCHLQAPNPLRNLCTSDTKVLFHSGSTHGRTRTGFHIDFFCH